MKSTKTIGQVTQSTTLIEEADDLSFGQVVLVSARWVLVIVGLVLTLWDPAPLPTLRIQLVVIFLMAGANFYLHAQTLMRHKVAPNIIYGASAADLITVTLFIVMNGGAPSQLFTFYFPAVVAFAVVFPTRVTALYTTVTVVSYGLISLGSFRYAALTALENSSDSMTLLTRIIILVAFAVCGNLFLRIERERRVAAAEAYSVLRTEIEQRSATAQQV